MNHTYRVVWNDTLGVWHAVAEHARGRGKAKSRRLRGVALAIAALCIPDFAGAQALPTGGVITAGTGSLHETSDHLTINQSSGKLAIDWQSFSIGQGKRVTFNQPSAESVALNRVLGPDVSLIQGALDANGQVFLINPNGVLFTQTAQISAGALVASTLELSKDDFLAGRYRFSGDSTNAVVNRGDLMAAKGGMVALIAAKVENTGVITAPQGSVLLGAGKAVTLDMGGPVKLQVQEGAIDALIENGGAIRADGGTILLAAKAAEELTSTVINHTGILEAKAVAAGDDGSIILLGEQGKVSMSGVVDVSADEGAAGKAIVSGEHILIEEGASIRADGAQGGEIFIGGGWQGRDQDIKNAKTTTVASGAKFNASGTDNGDGGTVVVWSDEETRFSGAVMASGGKEGRGGQVEVSGKQTLSFAGDVNTGGGVLLLDPTNIVVQNADGDGTNTFSGGQIRTLLDANNLVLAADQSITWNGDATLDYDGLGTDRTLTLHAGNHISISGSISDSDAVTSADALTTVFDSGGGIQINGTVHSGQGGDISIIARDGGVSMQRGRVTAGGLGNLDIQGSSALTMNSSHLNVENGTLNADIGANYSLIWGATINSTGAGGITLTSRGGSINLGGSVTSSTGRIASTGAGNITLTANALNFNGSPSSNIGGNGELVIQPYETASTIGIGDGAAGTLALRTSAFTHLNDGFSLIRIGRANGTGAIDVRNAAFKDNLVIRAPSAGGSIAINGALSTTGESITLESAGGISQAAGGAIQAGQMLLLGAGEFDLDAGSNNIGTLAADIDGSLAFHDSNGLMIGSVGGTHGVTATGTIDVATRAADLTVSQAVSTADASDRATVLNAGRNNAASTETGGDVILNATLAAGNDGRISIYTGSLAGSTGVAAAAGGSGSGRYRYGSDETTTRYTSPLGSGVYVIYRERPSLTITPGTVHGTYGSTPDLSGVTYTTAGYQNGDEGGVSGTASYTTTATTTSNVGTYDVAYSGGLSHHLGYAFSDDVAATGEYAVTPRVLNLSGTRAYDGTTDLAAAIFSLGNLVNGDTLNLTGTGAIADRHVGDNKSVALGTLALADGADGDLASNYTLAGGTHAANITKARLTLVGGFVANDKIYDATTHATIADASGLQLNGLAAGEDLGLTGLAAAFAGKDAAHGKTVSLTAAGLADGNAGRASDYTLDMTGAPTDTAEIMRRPVTVTAHSKNKRLGTPDPELGYTAEAQSTGRGLISGEVLNGHLVRQSGNGIGRHPILQGTLVDANNPNYQISFVEGIFNIDPSPEVMAAQYVAKVLPNSVAPDQAFTMPVPGEEIGAQITFSSLNSSEDASTRGSTDKNENLVSALSGVRQPNGPITVFVIEGGIRYPHMSPQ